MRFKRFINMSGNDESVNVMTSCPSISTPTHTSQAILQNPGMKKKKGKNNNDDAGSSDEERWLKAIETGKLDEVDDELKKITKKDPNRMTARQRAMSKTNNSKDFAEELVALPSGYRIKKLTLETLQQKEILSQRRKQKAIEKREMIKKRTMERLLKKRESKSKNNTKSRITKTNVNNIVYISRGDKIHLQFPDGVEFPLKSCSKSYKPPPKQQMCGVDGCTNPKKYNCSQTGIPLCSLECYKANQLNIQNTVC